MKAATYCAACIGSWLVLFQALPAAQPLVIDRVAVVVGTHVITGSEVLQELRLSQFENQQAPTAGPAERRAAAERLVDQQLIRNEMQISGFQQPSQAEGDAALRQFRKDHYPGDAAFRAALQKYGISEEDLKRYLAWQLAVIRFTDVRFRPVAAQPTETASRMSPGSDPGSTVDEQMDAWLKRARASTRIRFKQEAFR
jgi:hypothetical protein